jgi:hypothetical protein
MIQRVFFLILLNLSLYASTTPTDVYNKLLELNEDVKEIKSHFGIETQKEPFLITTPLLPRHVWQRTYEIFVKINILRRKNNLPIIEPINMEPTINLDPDFSYEQVLRLIQEFEILKFRLGIINPKEQIKRVENKNPTDVYNLLSHISNNMDLINGKQFTPSYVFGEAMRIYEDLDDILTHLKIDESSIPPSFESTTKPSDVFDIAIDILNYIKYLELTAGIKTVDFYSLRRENITPSDVFEITQIILAEIQVIKAYIGLNHNITRGARYFENKKPANVAQLLGWNLKRLRYIKSLIGVFE